MHRVHRLERGVFKPGGKGKSRSKISIGDGQSKRFKGTKIGTEKKLEHIAFMLMRLGEEEGDGR